MSDRIEVMVKAKNCGGGHNLKRLLALLFIAILLLSIVPTVSANPWASYKEIKIYHTKVDATLENFPVLISITEDTDLRDDAQNSGNDIVFTDGTNSIRLDHEIEYFDGSNGALQAWVRIPSLSSGNDTVIRMYYGNPTCGNQENPTGVWDSNYKLVQHLNETSGTQYDSTANDNDGEVTGATMDATGQIDGADDFDGTDDYVTVPNSDSLNIGGTEITLSAWIRWDIDPSSGNNWATIINRWGDNNWGLQHNKTNFYLEFFVNAANGRYTLTSTTSPSIGNWYYIVGVYDGGSDMQIYVHGVSEDLAHFAGGNIDTSTSDVYIGVDNDKDRDFNGKIDEVRISNTARSGDWINTTHNNQNSPSTFYSVGDETPTGGTDPVPELPTVILFAVGLVVLTGYVMLRRRKTK